jgi:multiple sugar transport system ATP-binding protein
MTAIDLVGLGKQFGRFSAVTSLSLAVRDKELVALLGPSGCGKTTTMNMIAGIETPSAGAIRFDGRDVSLVPSHRRNIGFVFQNYAIFTHMSVRENLAFALRVRGVNRRDIAARVARIADLMRLSAHLDRPSASLSVNEMQKLAIGRSAIAEPAIFLLDEPLSNVDAAFRIFMRAELKRIQQELRQTMVYVTHDQTEAMSLADRIAVMDQGVLQQYGTPDEVYNAPRNVFVARFMGSPSMNLLPARLVSLAGRPVLDLHAAGTLALTQDEAARLAAAASPDRILLGFRPEQAELAAPDDPREGIAMRVDLVEPIGPRTIVHTAAGGAAAKIVAGKHTRYAPGAPVRLVIGAGARRYFDATSGLALAGGGRDGTA